MRQSLMKRNVCAGLFWIALALHAAEAPKPDTAAAGTNAPASGKKDEAKPPVGTVPDATHKAILVGCHYRSPSSSPGPGN
jgi:hypothetical protein